MSQSIEKIYENQFNESNSYLLKKTKRNMVLKNEIMDHQKKKEILKNIKNERKNLEKEKDMIKYKNLVSFLEKSEEGQIETNKFSELLEIDELSNLKLEEKLKNGFNVSYTKNNTKDKKHIKEYLFFYKIPKLIGKIFETNNLELNVCYTDFQIIQSIINNSKYDSEDYYLNNKNELITNIFHTEEFGDIPEILFLLNNKLNFDIDDINEVNLFSNYNNDKNTENPFIINKAYFFYFDIPKNLQKNYLFLKTKKRNLFIEKINQFIYCSFSKIFYISGQKGIGKSATLLYYSGLNIGNVFYFNFRSIYKQTKENIKNVLFYEVFRFLKVTKNSEDIHIKKIFESINSFVPDKSYKFIIDLINSAMNYYSNNLKIKLVIILDQFNNKYFNLCEFKKEILKYANIKIIISSSFDNEFILTGLQNSLNFNDSTEYKLYFCTKLLDSESNSSISEQKEETEDISNFYGSPDFYYLLKEQDNQKFQAKIEEIQKEITDFIKNDISIIMEILIFVNYNYLLSSEDIKNKISKIPIKYISISKKKIIYSNNIFYVESEGKDEKKAINISKINKKFILYYLSNQNFQLTKAIEKYFLLDEFPDEILEIEFKPKNILSKKLYSNYYENIIKTVEDIGLLKKEYDGEKSTTVYKLDFLFPYIKIIFMKIIYDYIKKTSKNFDNLINTATEGQFFELLVIYKILSDKKLLNISIDKSFSFKSIVPNSYSIKMFSYKQKDKLRKKGKNDLLFKDFEMIFNFQEKNKSKLPKKGILFIQDNSNGKYYDFAILIPDEGDNNYILLVFQVSIKKDETKYLSKSEHEINLFFVKKNIETKYDINITEGYFYFILQTDNQNKIIDKNTFKNYKNMCIGFNINDGFSFDGNLLNKEALITKKFFYINEESLLKNFKNDKAVQKIKNLIMVPYENIPNKIYNEIKDLIINKNGNEVSKKQFHYLGNTDMSDSIKSLTDFFIFIKKGNKLTSIYLDGCCMEIDKIIENNMCIISDYQINFIK